MASMDDSQTDDPHKHRGGGGGSSSNGHTAGERGERRFNAYVQRLFPFVRRLCESRSIANRAFFRPPIPPLYDFSSHGMDEAVGRIPAWQVKDDTLIGLRIPDSLVLDAGGEYGRATVHPIGAPSSSTDATLPASAAAASAGRASLAHKLITFATAISQYHRLFNDGRREPPICDFLRQQACTRRPRMVFVPWSETYEPPSPPPPPADEKAARRKRRGRDWCGGCMGGGCGSGAAPAVDLGVDCDDHDCCDQATEVPSPPPPDPAFIPCLVCPVDGAQTVTLYFHGNGADLGMVSHICQATATALNSTLIAIDYPGYGVCNTTPYGGEPSEEACVAAALRVLRYVLRTTCSVGGDSNDSVCAVTQPTTDDAEETLTAAVYSAPTSPSSNAAPSETPPPPPFALSPDRGSPSGAQRRVSTTDPSVGGASGSGGNGGHAAGGGGGSSGEGTNTTTTSHRIERIPTVEWSAGAAAAANGGGAGGAGGDSYEFSDIATAHSTMRLRPVALDRIILFGQSIGTGVAMQLYRLIREGAVADLDPRRNVAGIILHSPFTSLRSIVASIASDEAKTAAVRQSVPQPLPDHCTSGLAAVETLRVLLSDGAPIRAKHPVEPLLFGLGALLLRERFRSIDVINDVVAAQYTAAAVVESADQQQQRPHQLGSDQPPPLADNTGVQLPPFFIVHGVLDNLIPVQSALALADAICAAPRPAMPAEEPEVPNEFRLPGLRLVLRPHGGHNGILALEEKAAFVREVIEPTVRMKYMTAEGHGEAITPYFARALVKGGVPAKDAESAYLRKAEQLSRSQACDTVVLTALGVLVTVFGAVALPLIGRTSALSCGPAGTDSSAAESAMLNAIGACTRVGLTLLLWAVLSFFQPSTGIHLQPPTRGNCAVVMYAVGRVVLGAMLLVGVAMGIVEGVWLFSVSPAEQACWGSMVLVPGIVTASFGAFCAVLVIAALVRSH